MGWKYAVRRAFWSMGLDISKDTPDNSLPSYLRMIFRELAIDCVLDVGAHRGEFATGLRTFGYRGPIISFEPVSSSFKSLQQAASQDDQWEVHNFALGSEDGSSEINITEGTVFSSFLLPVAEKIESRESVQVRRLDGVLLDLLKARKRVFLKMDTQGFDLEVMRGATGVSDYIAAVLTEMSIIPIYNDAPTLADSLAHMQTMGFYPSAMFPVTRRGHRLVEIDCVLVR